ncbi:hypothetical protein COW99_05440 [Candidatus Roizmanbacteria bacterium CG22_combo_CG10-13_8_21_14_all_38_20]|uniref:Uncharacterized protein n=1 Tax=Candidatus Roizmanbacteria bacterium CG22_combo_CG10-13_8_21_14_all_38_20 TaxID=1974862 RepID=A0A2H0BU64_9BACT|nr:type IV secretion system DNA-binding domain-containing protein [Candidatus Microgenomates bacterium]PIP61202.1 MAG: hypothetical protein COW99_05440 [Candidatus Roizmanbacteria bacterium CG22_combo_CG10-13_8_21_14_all_38_20]PJC31192.1 MAG: hypothetical protein CO050_04100 [Candidatus Roizmanbacteria bacterium CG_4_9_14_0_2_um_filter_38_17]
MLNNTIQPADIISSLELYIIIAAIFIFLVAAAGLVTYALILYLRWRNREDRSLDMALLHVALPRDNEVKIDAAEQFFASLSTISSGGEGIFKMLEIPDHLTFEIVATAGDIRFYVSTPRELKDLVEKHIHGAYPGAEVKEVSEFNIFSKQGHVEFTSLKLAKEDHKPIKIYKDLPTDPLSSLTAGLAKMGTGEGAMIQYMIYPAKDDWAKTGREYISSTKKKESNPEEAKYNVEAKTLEAIENKVSKSGFETEIRIIVSSSNKSLAKMHLDNIKSSFSQFNSTHNKFTTNKIRFKGMFMLDVIYRYLPMLSIKRFKRSGVLSTEELATIIHFPNKTIETPGIYWLNAKRAPAPANMAKTGMYIGKSVYRGMTRPVYLNDEDRARHMYIIGKTGVGKSEQLKSMAIQDIRAGKGICVMDPHGDLIEDLLPMIPPERAEDVIHFDPSDTDRPMGMNLLEAKTEEQKHFIANSIIGLMYKLYDPMKTGIIGPRFEHAVRNAMLTVMSDEGATFVEIVRVLTDAKYVQQLLPKVQDPVVRRYWTDQIAQTSDFHKSEVLDYIVSKFGRFVTNKTMRNIIGQSKSAFDFRKVMDEGKILLINLSKGALGEENSQFLGLVIVPKILVAAMSRVDTPRELRKDFYLYVDEFQNFATPDFSQILSEARKFKLNLCVANQFIGQMEEEVKNAVFGNVGTLVAFRVGVTDANYLQHEFQPTFNESDLINIERFHAYMRTQVNNEPVPPFSVDLTRDLEAEKRMSNLKIAEAIKKLSRLKYGRAHEVVEAEINQRAQL